MPAVQDSTARTPAAWYARFDWNGASIGAPDRWPAELRAIADHMCRTPAPQFMVWGPELALVYNEAYLPVLDGKHPAMGRPMREVWAEVWDVVEPIIERTLAGEPLHFKDHPFHITRNGVREIAWITFSYTPLLVDGRVVGVQCQLTETTPEVKAEQIRLAQVQRLTALFEQAPGFVAVTRGREHVYEIANRAYLEFVGREGIVGLSVRQALPELDAKFIDLLNLVFDRGEAYVGRRVPVDLQRNGGGAIEERIVDFVFQPIFEGDGQVGGLFIQGMDITEQAVAERAADMERRRLDAVIESLPSGIAFADPDGAITHVNAANRSIWGEHPTTDAVEHYGEWEGWWADGSERHGRRVQASEWALARAVRGETVRGDIVEIQPFDARARRTLLLQATPVRLDNGELAGAVVAQTDISDRVRAEAELRESEARFRTIAEAMPQMVWSSLPDGHHDYYNSQWYEFTGMPPGSTDGEGWAEILHPDDRERVRARWDRSLATGEDYETQVRVRHRSGAYRWALGRAVPLRDDGGRIVRWMGTCTDIHEQRIAQDALERSERALREADRRKDEFLAMLAHELRNPLAPISTASQLLLMTAEPTQVRAAGEIIGRQVRHMTELVDDLLDVSRVTRGLVQLDMETLDIKAVIAGAIEQVRALIDSRRHALRTRLPASAVWVRGDRTRLTQIVANLLNNAAKYTPEGGELTLEVDASGPDVAICVRDNGQGISAELLPQVFELFTQGERSPDRAQGGLGIGLALVRSLVVLHGGSIAADSAGERQGATFTVTLPSVAAPPVATECDAPSYRGSARGALDVVVVDDNVDAAQTLCALLEAMGHRVRAYHRGLDALEAIAARPADLALLDIGLPDITGFELARRIRERVPARAGLLAALTGYGQAQDRLASAAAGFDEHLVKPIDVTALADLLAQAQRRAEGAADASAPSCTA